MAYENMEGGCSAQMKCPHCGETIDLTANKGESSKEPAEESPSQEGSFNEQEFREYMSPRNDEGGD